MESIELNEFIKSTLIDIARGVKEANNFIKESENHMDNYFSLLGTRGDSNKTPGISFDIAVSATKNQKDKAGFMVALATIGGGANLEKGTGAEIAHRIKFEVGLRYDYTGPSNKSPS